MSIGFVRVWRLLSARVFSWRDAASRLPGAGARSLVACVCVLFAVVLAVAPSAFALTEHKFVEQITEVPVGSGASVTGAFTVNGLPMAVDEAEHRVWALNYPPGEAITLDAFDSSTGEFKQQVETGMPGEVFDSLAVGHHTGQREIYVATSHKLAVFGPSGARQATWSGADTPSSGFTGNISGIAVDESGAIGDWAKGDVLVSTASEYKAETAPDLIDVFEPLAGGGERYVTRFTLPAESAGAAEMPDGVAVSAFNGDVYVTFTESETQAPYRYLRQGVDVFEPEPGIGDTYKLLRALTAPSGWTVSATAAAAVDGVSGDAYVPAFEGTGGTFTGGTLEEESVQAVFEYDASGALVGGVYGANVPSGSLGEEMSVAVDGAAGHVFAAGSRRANVKKELPRLPAVVNVFGPNVVVPNVAGEGPTNVRPTSAVFHGKVDALESETGEGAECWFVYGTSTSFGETAACTKPVSGTGAEGVQARVTGLQPDTTYYYRLQASNGNGSNLGEASEDQSFTTPGPGLAGGQWASDVGASSARLNAAIVPHGAPTSYYFQYSPADTASCGEGAEVCMVSPTVPAALGSGEEAIHVERQLEGLSPSTVYHYRLVVSSEWAPGQVEVFYEADRTFTTQSPAASLALPDGRQWELVSTPNVSDVDPMPIDVTGEYPLSQASASGLAFTYSGLHPTEGEPNGYAERAQVLAYRGIAGWSAPRDVVSSIAAPQGALAGNGGPYRFFSEDLSVGVEELLGDQGVSPPEHGGVSEVFPPVTERTPYLRHDATCAQSPGTCFEPFLTGAKGYADVPAGTKFGPQSPAPLARFVAATPDGQHVILKSSVSLTEAPAPEGGLYEWSDVLPYGERLRPVSVLPPSEGGVIREGEIVDAPHVVSTDGLRVVFQNGGHGQALYLRDLKIGQTVKLGPSALFQGASADGSRVFFTSTARLVPGAGATGADLYECRVVVEEVAGKPTLGCELSDLTLPPAAGQPGEGEAASVLGRVAGVSEDGEYLYFVAAGVQARGATAGQPNLYVSHGGQTTFIATLSSRDTPDWAGQHGSYYLQELTARVAPNGKWFAFMSDKPLTGYDNRDALSGERDEEVFLYHAGEGVAAGRLVCASCDPTGARPLGRQLTHNSLVSPNFTWPGRWVAASIPAWTGYETGAASYQSRYLSDTGRLFFDSNDALVSQDTNGSEDVYEYEPPGVGSCESSSSTFAVAANGCVGLISSGVAHGESAFMDASETGDDVFFLSAENLASGAIGTGLKVYDAHVCSTTEPCPAPVREVPPCTTTESCRAAPMPQPVTFGAPPSATFSGAGNVATQPPRSAHVQPRRLTRAQLLRRALKRCARMRERRKRSACVRTARKRYGGRAHAGRVNRRAHTHGRNSSGRGMR
jgi:hypothetical protein